MQEVIRIAHENNIEVVYETLRLKMQTKFVKTE